MRNISKFNFRKKFLLCWTLFTLITLLFNSSCRPEGDASKYTLFGFSEKFGASTDTDTGTIMGATLSSTNGSYAVYETNANGSLDLTLVLTKKPASDVTIPLSSSSPADATVSPASITFTPSNWKIPQHITITGTEEGSTDGNQVISLVFGAATSSDPEYSGYTIPSITGIVVIDDDPAGAIPPGIIITAQRTPVIDRVTTTESGGTGTFAVILNKAPAANVIIPSITSSLTAEGTVDKTSLTFTPANWNVPQIVTVTGVDDVLLDNDKDYDINLGNSTSGDAAFNNLTYYYFAANQTKVPMRNIDNEVPSVVVTPTTLNLTEGGTAGTFTVNLSSKPTGNVTIPVTSGDPARATVSTTLLTFTVANYLTPQTVTVTPVDNNTKDGTIPPILITLGVATGYGNVNPDDVTVNITDNDTASIVVSTLSRNTTEAGQNANFNVKLTSQPTANVIVTINEKSDPKNNTNQEGTIDKTTLTFTSANWNTPQVVTVTPVNDFVMDGNVQYQIAVSNGSSTDTDYNNLAPTPNYVTVNNVDNDIAGFEIVANGATTLTERAAVSVGGLVTDDSNQLDNNTYSSFTIKLRSEPTADVTLNLAVSTSGSSQDGKFVATNTFAHSLTFTSANWNSTQSVVLKGNSTGANEGNIDYSVTITPSTTDSKYSSTTFVGRPSISIYSCDNDAANVLVGCRRSGLSTSEGGGTAVLYFITQSNPGANVCVPVNSNTETEGIVTLNGDGSASTAGPPRVGSATITTANWNTMTAGGTNKVTITGQNDAVFDGNVAYTLVVANPTCGGVTYTGFNPPDVTIRNTDDEQALSFEAAAGNTSENGTTNTFRVRLASAVSYESSFTIACAGGSTECASVSPTTVIIPSTNDWQTITVTGKDDAVVDGTQNSCLTYGTIASIDPYINGITPPGSCPISNADNDKAVWIPANGPWAGNFNSGMSVADSYCNDGADANKPTGIGTPTYKALIVDSSSRRATTSGTDATGQLNWVLQANTDYFLKLGAGAGTTKVFRTNAWATATFPLTSAFSGSGSDNFWTGLNSNWTTAANTCSQWTNDTAGFNGQYGVGASTSSASISSANAACTSPKKLICVQQ